DGLPMLPPTRSDRRIPGNRNLPITRPGLLDIGERWERIVECLNRYLLGDQHVVHLAARLLGLGAILIEEGMPAGIAREQGRMVGDVRLDVDFARSRRDDVRGVADRVTDGRDR